ncbi:hypothetical protein [Caballeronia sp. LZ035]|uniref:hypothetical protein n=1 Tax=Caballeronia sp. LZ035 TaxID=3038568 RepID=UPI0028650B8F|nr:hypothetical protein [Caballeronia sp. LZ035]MDR5757126.1 hypothetical protein [Caballeronia sp. LZ035]
MLHDIGSTQMQFGPEGQRFEAEQFEQEWSGETSGGTLNEAEAVQLASELLEVSNEAELDRFIGDLIGKVGQIARSPIGQAVGGVLKGAAAKALPLAGGALGGYLGGPLGAQIGSGLASAAGSALGLEAESMSGEDREFEGAKQFVKFAADTARNAASSPVSADPRSVAQAAAIAAARLHAPALLSAPTSGMQGGRQGGYGASMGGQGSPGGEYPRERGHWVRKGRHVILYGV